jgi:hypothetical protein
LKLFFLYLKVGLKNYLDKKSPHLQFYKCSIPATNVLFGIHGRRGDSTMMPPPPTANNNQLMSSGGQAMTVR